MTKRGMIFLVLTLIIFSFSLEIVSASLGVSPAGAQVDFEPGGEYDFRFEIIVDDPNQEIELTLGGDLAEYATLDKDTLLGGGIVNVHVKLPDEIDTPGFHEVGLSAKEKLSEERFLGTTINVMANMKVFVPYPGRYLESRLSVPDGNVDEEIPVELRVFNRGKENVIVDVYIDFLSEGTEQVFRMPFQQAQINTTQDRYFRKFLDTTGFRPGEYLANAFINYGEITTINQSFRIGSLFVNVNNFTEELPKGSIQKYHIDIESKWNNYLEEVFADVNVSNKTKEVLFRTPSVDLRAWEKITLEGFIDTTDLDGKYNAEIVLNYAEQQTFASGILTIYTISRRALIIGISVGLVVLIVAIIIIFIILRRKRYKRKIKKIRSNKR